jgi:hypothetical protein
MIYADSKSLPINFKITTSIFLLSVCPVNELKEMNINANTEYGIIIVFIFFMLFYL